MSMVSTVGAGALLWMGKTCASLQSWGRVLVCTELLNSMVRGMEKFGQFRSTLTLI